MLPLRLAILGLVAFVATQPVRAQAASDHVSMGIAAEQALDPAGALRHYKAALAQDSFNYEANWRAALALVDLGQQTPDSVQSASRDSLYAAAEGYARRAVAADSTRADGHFALAVALGRASLTQKKKERVRRAAEIRSEALKAIAINPEHDGAFHVLGRWHAEIMRLSGLSRLLAKTFMGGDILGQASWQGAIDNLEQAVRLAPYRIQHHLELASVYIDRKRYADARAELRKVDSLPATYLMDQRYKMEAVVLRQKLDAKQ